MNTLVSFTSPYIGMVHRTSDYHQDVDTAILENPNEIMTLLYVMYIIIFVVLAAKYNLSAEVVCLGIILPALGVLAFRHFVGGF